MIHLLRMAGLGVKWDSNSELVPKSDSNRKNRLSAVFLSPFILAAILGMALSSVQTQAQDEQYWQVVSGRAGKIVRTMDLNDPAKGKRVQDIIAMQYVNLSAIHDSRDSEIKAVEERTDLGPAEKGKRIATIKARSEKKVEALHRSYLKDLSAELTPEQVDMVKDGTTYGLLGQTYQGYLSLLPDLTEEQKNRIMKWLVEAREIAMDAGSSEEKHYWFRKYKGKINNYLSAEGYDLKKAEQ